MCVRRRLGATPNNLSPVLTSELYYNIIQFTGLNQHETTENGCRRNSKVLRTGVGARISGHRMSLTNWRAKIEIFSASVACLAERNGQTHRETGNSVGDENSRIQNRESQINWNRNT